MTRRTDFATPYASYVPLSEFKLGFEMQKHRFSSYSAELKYLNTTQPFIWKKQAKPPKIQSETYL